MKKIILLAKRKSGMTMQQFRSHYEQHAQLATKLLHVFKSYQRNYVRHDLIYRPAHLEGKHVDPDFDVITEMTFETENDYQEMVYMLADPDIQTKIVEDGERFMDRSCMQMFFVDEESTPQAELKSK